MKKTMIPKWGWVAALMSLAISVQGAVVVVYDFPTSQGTSLPSASTDTDPLTSAGSLSLGVGVSGTSGISSTSGDPVNSLFLRNTNNSSEANAVLQNKYFTFAITSASALEYSLLDLEYQRGSSTAATNFAIRTDAGGDNFTTTIAAAAMSDTGVWNTASLDLTGVSLLQDVTGTVTFRVYVWGASGISSDSQIIRFDNLEMTATVVPEPASATILLAGGLALLALRTRAPRRAS